MFSIFSDFFIFSEIFPHLFAPLCLLALYCKFTHLISNTPDSHTDDLEPDSFSKPEPDVRSRDRRSHTRHYDHLYCGRFHVGHLGADRVVFEMDWKNQLA